MSATHTPHSTTLVKLPKTTKFEMEERVVRQRNPKNKFLGKLHGRIVAIRKRPGMPELYDVRWDHDTTILDKGYLPFGLEPELPGT